jgi:putative transposase
MDEYKGLSHIRLDFKYHVAVIPKCRRKSLSGKLQQDLGDLFHSLVIQKQSQIVGGHMMIAPPPKHAVSNVIGLINLRAALTCLA